jgi:hypothetical protein
MHGLQTLVDVPVTQDLRKRTQLLGFVLRLHRHVRPIPIAHDAQPFEVFALSVHLLERIFTTRLPEGSRLQRLHFLTAGFLDLVFDRQSVTIPTRHVWRIVSV